MWQKQDESDIYFYILVWVKHYNYQFLVFL